MRKNIFSVHRSFLGIILGLFFWLGSSLPLLASTPQIAVSNGANPTLPYNGILAWGSLAEGSSGNKVIKVRNLAPSGSSNLVLGTPTMENTSGSAFSIGGTLASPLPPGSDDNFVAVLNTSVAGSYSAVLRIPHNDPTEPNPFRVTLTATITGAAPPEIAVSNGANPALPHNGTLAWGSLAEGSSGNKVIKVRNLAPSGSSNLVLGTPTTENTSGSAFSVGGTLASPLSPGSDDNFVAVLNTSVAGSYSAVLRIPHNDPTEPNPFRVTLTATITGAAPPEIAVSNGANPALPHNGTLAWGTVAEGSSGNKVIKVRNLAPSGSSNLVLGIPTMENTSGSAFSVGGTLASPLPPGSDDNFVAVLNTSVAGSYSAVLRIPHNDPTEPNPFRVTLTATITGAAPPEIAVSNGANPALPHNGTLAWGSLAEGSSGNKVIKVRNLAPSGSSNLVLGTPTMENTSGSAFSIGGTLASPLSPGSDDNFVAVLNTSVAGSYSAVLRIPHNDPTEPNPFRVTLTATITGAAPPEVAVSNGANPALPHNGTLAWGSLAEGSSGNKVIKVRNLAPSGSSNLVLGTPTMENTSGSAFSVGGTLASPLPPGSDDNFVAVLNTSVAGSYSAVLRIPHNDPTEPNPFRVTLTATITGAAPPQIAVSNGANPALPHNGTLAWGTVAEGSSANKAIKVRNIAPVGSENLILGTPFIQNTSGSAFSLSGTLTSPLAPGASDNFAAVLNTSTAGSYSAVIQISHNDPSVPSPFLLNLTAIVSGSNPPRIVVSNGTNPPIPHNGTLAWGVVEQGEEVNKAIKVRNLAPSGSESLVLGVPTIQNTAGSAFSLAGTLDSPLVPGTDDNFAAHLDASEVGSFAAVVSIPHNDPSVPSPFRLNLSAIVRDPGAGDPPRIQVSHGANPGVPHLSTLAFEVGLGEVNAGKSIRVTNAVTPPAADLIVGPPTLVNTSGEAMSLGGALLSPLAPGQWDPFAIRFDTSTEGSFTAVLTIPHNDPSVPNPFQLTISVGVGQPVGAFDSEVVLADTELPGRVEPGDVFPASITLLNSGSTTWEASEVVLETLEGTDDLILPSSLVLPPGVNVPPGGRHTFEFQIEIPVGTSPGLYAASWQLSEPALGGFGERLEHAVQVGGPEVSTLSPHILKRRVLTRMTVEGRFFQGASVYVATEQPDGSGPNRAFPTAQLVSVNSGGTRLVIDIDTRSRPGAPANEMEGWYTLAIETADGIGAGAFRVVPDSPVVDAWTPSELSAGDTFALSILGANLTGASVRTSHPQIALLDLSVISDEAISGVLAVESGFTAQNASLIVSNAHGSVSLPLEVLANLAGMSKTTRGIGRQGGPPAAYLQDLTINQSSLLTQQSRTAIDHSRAPNFCFGFSFQGGFSFRDVYGALQLPNGEPLTRSIVESLQLNDTLDFNTLIFAVWGNFNYHFQANFCSGGMSDLRFEVSGEINFVIPLVGSQGFRFQISSGMNFQWMIEVELRGAILNFRWSAGNGRAEVDEMNPDSESGSRLGTIRVVECGEERIAADFALGDFPIFGNDIFSLESPTVEFCLDVDPPDPEEVELRVFLDIDDDNPFSTSGLVPVEDLSDLDEYISCSDSSMNPVPVNALPHQVTLVAVFVHADSNGEEVEIARVPEGVQNIRFRLTNTSRFSGIAMNWPQTVESSPGPDFFFDVSSQSQEKLVPISGNRAKIPLLCNDYGGFTSVQAEALDAAQTPVHQTQGPIQVPEPYSSMNRLPKKGWKTTSPGTSVPVDSSVHGEASDGDQEPIALASGGGPVGLNGDRLSAYEEYRGFVYVPQAGSNDLILARTNPKKKTLFTITVPNSDPQIESVIPRHAQEQIGPGYFDASRLEIIVLYRPDLVQDIQQLGKTIINFQRQVGHSLNPSLSTSKDQNAVTIVYRLSGATGNDRPLGVTTLIKNSDPSVPANIKASIIFPVEIKRRIDEFGSRIRFDEMTRSVVAHELGHAVDMCHREEFNVQGSPKGECRDGAEIVDPSEVRPLNPGNFLKIMHSGYAYLKMFLPDVQLTDPAKEFDSKSIHQIRLHRDGN